MPRTIRDGTKHGAYGQKTRDKRRRNGRLPRSPPYHWRITPHSELEFRILGQLEAIRGNRTLSLGSPKQRALLGFLLLHANEPVARERLIEALWGDAAPVTVRAVLNTYLSRIRRELADGVGDAVLATQAAGYVLYVRPEQLDAHRFESLLERGRQELAREEVEEAASTLRQALALWRGPALADFAYEEFAQGEITRLEELRLAALEDRIDADLALSRHGALVAALEALVAEHPYRERLCAQLMLALYRSGRQAEALETYRRTRRTFVEELGMEPSPRVRELEAAILRQDASLDAPALISARAGQADRGRDARLQRRVILGAIAAVGVVVAAVLFVAARPASNDSRAPVRLEGDSVALVDPGTDEVLGEIPVGGRPSGIAVGAGSVWVGNRDDETLLRIDPSSRKVVRTIGLGASPTDLAVGRGSIWVLTERAVLRIDPDINDVVARLPLPRRPFYPWIQIEAGATSVWVCSCATLGGALLKIDPETNAVGRPRVGPFGVIALGEGALWALTGYQLETIERIAPSTNTVVDTIPRARVGATVADDPRRIAVGAGAVWLAFGQALWKLDPMTDRFAGTVPLGHTPNGVAIGDEAIWVVGKDAVLLRVDPKSQNVAETIPLGVYAVPAPHPIAAGHGTVWVAVTP